MRTPGFILPGKYREFFRMLDSCEREVELITYDGYHLNMKSKLAQYVAMIYVFQNKRIEKCELITHSMEDTVRIVAWSVRKSGKNSKK